ncbi:pyridoxal phosphate-dependent aminotransferase [Amycolatopsis jejuensis]|uniref:pyridoxal phosphate-dependent aminotransferase n=1 Tax=Amycolatopsis jejuensis TaxID=330084 RepID=UPI0005278F65|nr:pyridoxal phosphate-dependent aminotransferase [Amycolatopsis jejuensis]
MTSVRHLMDPAYAARRATEADDHWGGIDTAKVAMLCIADPFWPDDCTPEHVRAAAIESLQADGAHYSSPIGERALRVEIAKRVARVNGLEVDPDRNVTVAGGSVPLFVHAMRPFLEPGAQNEILTPTPSWVTNFEIGPLAGGVTVPVPTYPEDGYDLRIDEFARRLTPRTKLVLIANPNNPTATLYSRRALEQLAAFARENDLIVVTDQAFEDTVFDGCEMTEIAALPGMAERTILISSLSKGMALCGYRIGYVVASEEITDVLHSSAAHILGAPSTAAQAAAVAALREPQFVEAYRAEYRKRADAICAMLDTVPDLGYTKPQSGYYLWLDVSAFGNAREVTEYLLREASVLLNEGDTWGSSDHLRLVYSTFADRNRCLSAIERMVDAFARHPKAAVKGKSR